MKEVFCDIEHCLACKACEIACAVEHTKSKNIYKSIQENAKHRIKVQYFRKNKEGYIIQPMPVQCRHCKEPLCISACMSVALSKDKKTGTVKYDKDKCVGCYMCVMVCPFGAIDLQKSESLILKCDHCDDSGEPACVLSCPTAALVFCEASELKRKNK